MDIYLTKWVILANLDTRPALCWNEIVLWLGSLWLVAPLVLRSLKFYVSFVCFGNLRAMSELIGSDHESFKQFTIELIAWRVNTPKQVKTNKTAIKQTPVSVVTEAPSIDAMFQISSLGYFIAPTKCDSDVKSISIDDACGYIVSKLEAGQSANRQAILFSAWVFKNKTIEEGKAFAETLKSRWSGSTIDNLLSISRALPAFEKSGLDISQVRDIYGLRECSKLLKGEETSKEAVKLLNSGESPRKVKSALDPKKEEKKEEPKDESESLESKKGLFEAQIITAVERFAIVADNEERLRLTRQIVSKMSLGNYILGHLDAIQAVHDLKSKSKAIK